MRKLHVFDPLLKNQGGHYIGQHLALWQLCQRANFAMTSYCDKQFDETMAPEGVHISKVFNSTNNDEIPEHYAMQIAATNQSCLDALLKIDVTDFGDNDVLFLTSATAEHIIGYGHWLGKIFTSFTGKVAIYNTLSAEIDDTMGRQLRRNGLTISDESFLSLDNMVVSNDFKISMYRFLFSSIPAERGKDVNIFYEDPFPNRKFKDICQNPDVDFTYLHSMYPGVVNNNRHTSKDLEVVYLGSGGVGDNHKGHHLLENIIIKTKQNYSDVKFTLQLGNSLNSNANETMLNLKQEVEKNSNVMTLMGALNCTDYCNLIEKAAVVLLPYGPRYQHIMSGIFDDCLFLGIPCVIPRNSKMALWLDRHNIKFPGFEHWNAEDVTKALDDALSNIDYYNEQFKLAQNICQQRWKNHNPFTAMGIELTD